MRPLAVVAALLAPVLAIPAAAQGLPPGLSPLEDTTPGNLRRYTQCMELARREPIKALPMAEKWQGEGGGLGVFRPEDIGPTSVHESLESALRLAAYALRARATVERDLREVPPVRGNVGLLVQVFLNILINAAQAMETYGTIQVRVLPSGAEWVDVEIEDNGEGIAPEHLPHLFEPFVTSKASGSGLGLSLVAKIVGDHGGLIEVDSRPGRTEFRLHLPVVSEKDED